MHNFYHLNRALLLIIITTFSLTIFTSNTKADKPAPFLILENPTDAGMFAVFLSVLGALNYYEINSSKFSGLKIDLNSGHYYDATKGYNWWEYFFEPINLGHNNGNTYNFSAEDTFNLATDVGGRNIATLFRLIQKYIHVKPHIQQEVDAFYKRHLQGSFVIGVHHRGTDKVIEWPIQPYEKTFRALNDTINSLDIYKRQRLKIYVATDDLHFLIFLLGRFPQHIVYSDFVRSVDTIPLHTYERNLYSSPYQMGKEALIDCLLLSKSNILIRPGTSCLSNVSSFMNPNIKTINVINY